MTDERAEGVVTAADELWESLAADIHAHGYSVRDAISVHRAYIEQEARNLALAEVEAKVAGLPDLARDGLPKLVTEFAVLRAIREARLRADLALPDAAPADEGLLYAISAEAEHPTSRDRSFWMIERDDPNARWWAGWAITGGDQWTNEATLGVRFPDRYVTESEIELRSVPGSLPLGRPTEHRWFATSSTSQTGAPE